MGTKIDYPLIKLISFSIPIIIINSLHEVFMKRPNIRLHFGASNDDISVDGHTFVRHRLGKKDFAFVRNVVIDTLLKVGMIHRRPVHA